MAAGPMFGQVHHFVKYNKGKAPYAEERFLKEAHRLYGVLESRLAQGMGSDAAAPGLILLCTARRQSRELRAMRITWVMACEEDDQDEAGSDPRLLRLTMAGSLMAHWGATPSIKIVRTMGLDLSIIAAAVLVPKRIVRMIRCAPKRVAWAVRRSTGALAS